MRTSTTTWWRKRAIIALTLGLVLAVLPGALAAGQEGDEGDSPDADVVLLHLEGSLSELIYLPASGDPIAQAFVLEGCEATLDTGGTVLMDVAPIPAPPDGALGIFKGLGVITEGQGGTGGACGRVDGLGEGLIFALDGELADRVMDAAEVDFKVRRSPVIVAELLRDGVVVGGAELDTSTAPAMTTEDGEDLPDMVRWLIDEGVTFDELRLTISPETPAGVFAVESGLEGTSTGELGHEETVFKLSTFDGQVECGGETTTVGDGETTPMVVFERGENNVAKGGDPECEAEIGFNLGSSASETDQTVTFTFETSELPSWWGTFTWAPEPAVVPIPATDIDEDADGTADGVIEWCSGFETDEGGEPVIDVFTGLPIPIMPAGDTWCLVAQNSELVGSGTMQVTQTIYGQSDPAFARPK